MLAGLTPWRKLLLIAPPGFAKSTYVSIVLPCWYLGEHPDHNLLFLTSSDTNAHQFNTVVKTTLADSFDHRAMYGGDKHQPDRERGWSHDGLYLQGCPTQSKDPSFRAVGYGASVIGARVHGIIMDDPLTQDESRSLKEQAAAKTYHDGTLDSRLHPDVGWEVAIMTRWDEKDLAAHLMGHSDWHVVVLPALLPRRTLKALSEPFLSFPLPTDAAQRREQYVGIFNPDGTLIDHMAGVENLGAESSLSPGLLSGARERFETSRDLDAPDGELTELPDDPLPLGEDDEVVSLWENRFPTPFLERKRVSDPALFGCLYQGDPTIYGGDLFKLEYLRQELPTLLPRMRVVQFWDTAFSERQAADYSACVTLGVDEDLNVYILHVYRKHAGPAELLHAMVALAQAFRPQMIGIERAAFRQVTIREIVRQLRKRVWFPVRDIPATDDKTSRARLPAGRAEAYKVFIRQRSPWTYEFLKELVGFPNTAHDDQVDAFSGAMQLLAENLGTQGPHATSYSIGTKPKAEKPWQEQNADQPVYVNLEGKPVTLGQS